MARVEPDGLDGTSRKDRQSRWMEKEWDGGMREGEQWIIVFEECKATGWKRRWIAREGRNYGRKWREKKRDRKNMEGCSNNRSVTDVSGADRGFALKAWLRWEYRTADWHTSLFLNLQKSKATNATPNLPFPGLKGHSRSDVHHSVLQTKDK